MDPTTHQMDVHSCKLTGMTNSISTTPHMDTCSWKLTEEANSTAPHVDVLWLTGKVMQHTLLDTAPQKLIGVVMTLTLTDRIPTKKEPCLTPTLMDEGQARNNNTTYNGYKMEFWKFALTWKLICPVQHKITQKEQKETTKKGGISLTIMGQRKTYNSIHKPQRLHNETLGFNQDDHLHRM